MSFTFTVDHARHWVVARAAGSIALDDIRNHLEEERAALGLPYSELIDARGYVPAFSASDVRMIIADLRRLAGSSRLGPTAVLVDSDVGYGMIRMLEILLEDVCAVRPFRRQEEAEQWLNDASSNPKPTT